jgi:hypothetical protein
MKHIPTKKTSGFISEFYETFKVRTKPMLPKWFQKVEIRGRLLN